MSRSIIQMALDAGFESNSLGMTYTSGRLSDLLECFAALIRADERYQAQERVVDLFADMEDPYLPDIVAAIMGK
jgi:hypothetical protein